jgi:hypothetical protein
MLSRGCIMQVVNLKSDELQNLANRLPASEMKKSFSILFAMAFLFAGKICGQEQWVVYCSVYSELRRMA